MRFHALGCAAIDPCIGDGEAFATIASGDKTVRYGIELDAYRADPARSKAHEVIYGSVFDAHCSVDSADALWKALQKQ